MSDLHIFGVNFEKTILLHEVCFLEFVLLRSLSQNKKSFVKKTKMPKFGTKNALFGYFGLIFENNIVILKSTRRICLIAKFREKK